MNYDTQTYTISNLTTKSTTTGTAKGSSARAALTAFLRERNQEFGFLKDGHVVFISNNNANHDFFVATIRGAAPVAPPPMSFERVSF